MLIKKQKIPAKEIILYGFLPSFIKKLIYRLKGYKIGKNVSFSLGSVIIGEDVVIEDNATFSFVSVIRARKIRIGRFVRVGAMTMLDTEHIEVGDDTRINENVIAGGLKTPESKLILGKRVIVMEYSFLNPTMPIIIGDDTGIGGHSLLFTHGSWLNQLDGYPVAFAPITIGDNVWIPWRVFIMSGTTIGDNVVVGANSVLSKKYPSNCVISGNPAVVKRENYPPNYNIKRKRRMFEEIFPKFIDHLQYDHFKCSVKEFENGKDFQIEGKKSTSEIIYRYNIEDITFKHKDNLLILFDLDGDINHILEKSKASMVIVILQKQRYGTSDIGEEIIRYYSRYGIRFNRN